MTGKTKSLVLAILLLSSMALMFPITSVAGADTTYLSVVNPVDGTTYFNYSNVEPPPTEAGYGLGYVIVNVTVTDVADLSGYQVNLTWDPSLLEIAKTTDVDLPSGHVFEDLDPMWMPPSIDNTVGYLGAVCACGPGAVVQRSPAQERCSRLNSTSRKVPLAWGRSFPLT